MSPELNSRIGLRVDCNHCSPRSNNHSRFATSQSLVNKTFFEFKVENSQSCQSLGVCEVIVEEYDYEFRTIVGASILSSYILFF